IFGFQNRFYKYEFKSPNKENQRDKEKIFYNFEETNNLHKRVSVTHWKAHSNYWHNISSKTENMISNKRQKPSYKVPRVELPLNSIVTEHLAAQLVDQEPEGCGAIMNQDVVYGH
ncbi:16914_t:CDS:2, partial [Racocetra persica]